ncbi:dihydrodipicolinate synthase [Limihaloglobus sulfuriphilus]|uniref:Dihydrodipicolinate synthase n=1 Tax=Limihaloglobus sulfuriphilus TaxID=1851148 RepID=A0A1Q2MEK8_9BACT|nr:dihydrodipicolinate synthase family protein [Limihaloglobus sulfuriphilus]AQQ70978.1 dihydrodipicolinate synthase [Limihaloglobus sulfuriphilus]
MIYQTLSDGLYPVALTPLDETKSIDWKGLEHLIEFYLNSGASGLFVNCASSEVQFFNNRQMLEISAFVVRQVNFRKPVLSGAILQDKIPNQANFIKEIMDTGVDVAVISANQIAALHEDDSLWQSKAEKLLHLTDGVPLGIYECPIPYHRLVSTKLYGWLAKTGRFSFHKDTSCDILKIKEKLNISRDSKLKFFNAHIDTLLDSLQAGGNGYSGIMSNFCPKLCAILCEKFNSNPTISFRLQKYLSNTENHILSISNAYPAVGKHFLRCRQVPIKPLCKTDQPELSNYQLRQLYELSNDIIFLENLDILNEGLPYLSTSHETRVKWQIYSHLPFRK